MAETIITYVTSALLPVLIVLILRKQPCPRCKSKNIVRQKVTEHVGNTKLEYKLKKCLDCGRVIT